MIWSLRRRGLAALVVSALAVIALGALSGRAALSSPSLPPVAADDLAASVARALEAGPTVSGEVAATADLGLPALPDELGDGAGDALGALSGDRRLRVWRSPDGLRVAELRRTAERALVVGPTDAWTWDSETQEATHVGPYDAGERPRRDARDPLEMARRALAALDDSTTVSVAANARVAGRDAYTLVLEPRTDATLVGRVEISVDAERRLPLRAAVYARGADTPAIEGAYTAVSFDPINPATFTFTPPPGATVVEHEHRAHDHRPDAGSGDASFEPPRTFGSGWATVVAMPVTVPADASGPSAIRGLLPFSGPLLSARMVSVDGTDWLLAGAVPQAALAEVEPQLR